MQPEDFWFSAPRKGVMVFALPGEPGLTELCGDFKINFHDRQGDFYWYLQFLIQLLSTPFYKRHIYPSLLYHTFVSSSSSVVFVSSLCLKLAEHNNG